MIHTICFGAGENLLASIYVVLRYLKGLRS